MTLRHDPIPYEEWVLGVFGQPEEHEFFDAWREEWDGRIDGALIAGFLARLFRDPSPLDAYTNVQIGRGLWALAGEEGLGCLRFEKVPDAQREDTVDAVRDLYLRILEPRCDPLPSAGKSSSSEINGAAYMLWDIAPFCPGISWVFPEEQGLRELDLRLTRLLAELLQVVENPASQESILHGFGHAVCLVKDRRDIQAAIDAFLGRPSLRPDIQTYARNARSGNVL